MELRVENGQVVEPVTPLIARFYEHDRKVGIGKFQACIYLELKSTGSKDSISRFATDEDKEMYSSAWDNYESGIQLLTEGTPLKQLPAFKSRWGLELGAQGITTVQELAAMDAPEECLQRMWKEAKLFIQLEAMEDGD